MPNHCANRLTIKGGASQINAFLEAFSHEKDGTKYYVYLQQFKKELTAEYIKLQPLPVGEVARMLWTPYGTKWGCYEFSEPVRTPRKLVLVFKTAWGPYNAMTQLFMSRKFPKLSFHLEFAESGQGFVGDYKASKGQLTEKKEENVCNTGNITFDYDEDDNLIEHYHPNYTRFKALMRMSG